MGGFPEQTAADAGGTQSFIIGSAGSFPRDVIAAQLNEDSRVRVVAADDNLITIETTPEVFAQLKQQLAAEHPGVIIERNALLER